MSYYIIAILLGSIIAFIGQIMHKYYGLPILLKNLGIIFVFVGLWTWAKNKANSK